MAKKITDCPTCGAEVRPKAVFCHRCGRPLTADAEEIAAAVNTQNLELAALTPEDLATEKPFITDTIIAPRLKKTDAPEQNGTPPIAEDEAAEIEFADDEAAEIKPTDDRAAEIETPIEESAVPEIVEEPADDAPFSGDAPPTGEEPTAETVEAAAETESAENAEIQTDEVAPPDETAPVVAPPVLPKKSRKARRYVKQTEYVWEETDTPAWRVMLVTIVALGLVALLLWLSNFLKF